MLVAVLLATGAASCSRERAEPQPVRLADVFRNAQVQGTALNVAAIPRSEVRFDAPARPGAPPAWAAGPGLTGLAVRGGMLSGRTTSGTGIVHLERTTGLENPDQLHAIEIRARVSAGTNLFVATRPQPKMDLAREAALAQRLPWPATTPLVAGDGLQTYVIRPPQPVSGNRIRHVLIRPSDVAGADFAIESVRLVFRREHLAGVPSGVSWQGLRDVFRETIVTRAPEVVRLTVTVPTRPVLDLSLGTPEDQPVTFRVAVVTDAGDVPLLSHTVTSAHRWERRRVDLARFAGREVTLKLSTGADSPGTIAFWGAPAIRQRVLPGPQGRPQVVILMQGDTLRTDHLDLYGYDRKTAPTLTRLGGEGAVFQNAITQTGWTKAATPAIMTSLYPTSHGVHKFADRLPASATTIAEAFREAGYATLSFSSVTFTGQFTNLHQGFEELHESESTIGRAGPKGAKTAREYVDRLLDWLDAYPDVPVFVYLHVFDPHAPYEPNKPFDTMWADPARREEYVKELELLKKAVADAFMAERGMATREELVKAGIDPEKYLRFSRDWYDGSIRGMDAELARLVERIEERGIAERSLLAFYADHGEEFHDHGRMWHGQSVYGEMIRVPLVLWGPGRVPKGVKVKEAVQLIDIMPTLLEMSGIRPPEAAQGQTLRPLLGAGAGAPMIAAGGRAIALRPWDRRPVVAEKQPMGTGNEHPANTESYAIIDGQWKLIHNVVRAPDKPEFELFDFYADPRDQTDLAEQNPEVVKKMAAELARWREWAKAARVKPDSESTQGMSAEQLEQLRSLGYIK